MSEGKQILAIIGATGNQGSSVISHVLSSPTLSAQFHIRAITRDPTSPSAQSISGPNVTLIKGDIDSPSSIAAAFSGVHTVFAATTGSYTDAAYEERISKQLADIAVAQGVAWFIYSTLPHIGQLSGGKYTGVFGFDGKANAEAYIRTLPIRSAFFAPGSFMQNFHAMMKPRGMGDGTFVVARPMRVDAKVPLVDIRGDTGKWVAKILERPEAFEGKVICAATREYSQGEQVEILGRVTGKKVVYKELSEQEWKGMIAGGYADMLLEMMRFQQEFGYYGEGTEGLVREAVEVIGGEATTFEEYLRTNPLNLE